MRIVREKRTIQIVPESDVETKDLQILYNTLVDCAKFNRKLAPVGEYIPEKENVAHFYVEGEMDDNEIVYAPADMTVYCSTCNKFARLKKGDPIPLCCGRIMESLD